MLSLYLYVRPLHDNVHCLALCSRFSCIFLLILNSIFFQTIGLQGEPLFQSTWRIGWLTGAMANSNDPQTSEILDPARTDQKYSKDVYLENHRCSSSFHHSFLQLLLLVCLPQSNGRFKDTTFESRNKVPTGRLCLHAKCSGSNEKVLRDEPIHPIGQENESDCVVNGVNESLDSSKSQTEISGKPCSVDNLQDESKIHAKQMKNKYIDVDQSDSKTDAAENLVNETRALVSKLRNIEVRQEPGDGLYNYASDSKGAKVLDSNKDAKGASNILNGDMDKYLRVPCSSENKFVDLELSEETLIISIAIANHEFYSSNVRQFELWGSLVYPAEQWIFLGRFNAENIRALQKFNINQPEWVRYLRMRMLTHYGADFYCTLSMLEVYGVDAIEWLLADWIAEETGADANIPQHQGETASKLSQLSYKSVSGEASAQNYLDIHESDDQDNDKELPELEDKAEHYGLKDINKPETLSAYHQTSRPALDAVMKLLMQKVRSFEQNQPLISHYIQELSNCYEENIKDLNRDLDLMSDKLNFAAAELANLKSSLHDMEINWIHEKQLLENDLVNQLKRWNSEMDIIRNHLDKAERKEMASLGIALLSGVGVIAMQIISFCLHLLKMIRQRKRGNPCIWRVWMVPFFGCIIVVLVLSV